MKLNNGSRQSKNIQTRTRWGKSQGNKISHIAYFAKAIAFGQLQDYQQALVWIERAEASAPEFLLARLVRSVLLALAGREDEAHATMQRYLANDKAPFRTMSEWRVRWAGIQLQSWSPRYLIWVKNFTDSLRKAGLPE